ncbi:hypothetical protein XELAEV_18031144mg [Xenopus laevis]|uniref:Kinesin motor domain-containing protein n=1 Tax=Xenopus laevis TaxID=8355 RepID=A0A974CMU6_XENLA|nr:hypothetical protein XELAEV_18031144mg [Xenopus laevis]
MPPVTKGDPSDVTAPLPCLPSAEGDAIKVFVRIRPPVEGTLTGVDGEQGLCLTALSSTTIRLHSKPEPKMFTFDHVANVDTTQESVFSSVAKNIVESCMNGYNGTIFAYGQTGSGKTFTMLGPSESDNFTHNLRGVIPRSFEYLFFLINREKEKAGEGKSFLCKCSFIEIYNKQIFDLLDSASAGLFLREHIKKGVFVVGAVEQVVTSAAEAYQVLSIGWRNRRVASTSMNRESPRSHAVFTVTIESMEKTNDLVNIRSSQLNLVDLAVSERQKDTQTEGVRLKEAGSINRSLSCLGQVITALVDVANGRQRHICYRDSKLTFLLRDSLGGNAKTFIIANVHPGSKCFGQTLSTLQFAQRAKLIKNKAVVNEDTQGNVSQLQAEVKKLKEQLSQLLSGQMPGDISVARVPSVGDNNMDYMNNFFEAMRILERSDREKKVLLQKVVQLEDLCNKKEKFIQSNKMIVKFREDHISRLEKAHKDGRISLSNNEKDDFIAELKEEIRTLKEQVEHHPRVAKYALENHSLREENKRLHSLQSVKRAQEVTAQMIAELEKAFLEASVSEKDRQVAPMHSTPIQLDNNSLMSAARMRERMLQLESELATSKQEYEEFKELTKKKQVEQESELQSLIKSNQHLENILEAIKANKRHEVSQLNQMHAETIKEQVTALQAKLDEEDGKNIRLQQQVNKLELCSTQIQELFNSERSNWNKEQQDLIAQIKSLQKQDNKSQEDVLKSEVHDLRVVLQSADRELGAVKGEYRLYREKQEKELSQLSARHMDVQLQLDNVRLEHETLLEEKRSLQDAFDNLEEVMKFEIDQLKQEISDSKHENETLRAELSNLLELLETEKERRQKLTSKLEEDKENKTKELLQVVDENMHLRKQCSELMTKCEQQVTELHGLEHSLTSSEEMIADLEKKNTADKEVVADLMNQIQVHRTTIIHKTESIDLLTRELEDIHSKYSIVLLAKEESKTVIEEQEKQIEELRECLERKQSADNIEKELLCDDLAHATEELGKLTEAFNKQEALLHTHEKELVEKEQQISELTNQVKLMTDLEISREQEKIRPASSNSSSPVVLPKTPRTPVGNPYDSEIANLQKRNTNLEILVSELNEERTSKNEEIIRLKMQLCETENMQLEIQNLQGMCKELKSQLENCNNVMKDRLEETRNILCTKDHSLNELSKEIERTRSLEAKAFTEKEEIRSILEGKYEETEKLSHELDMLRKQVLFLAEENGKIRGHQNPNQKIQYLVKLKKENNKLLEEAEKLRIENLFLKESKKCEHCN